MSSIVGERFQNRIALEQCLDDLGEIERDILVSRSIHHPEPASKNIFHTASGPDIPGYMILNISGGEIIAPRPTHQRDLRDILSEYYGSCSREQEREIDETLPQIRNALHQSGMALTCIPITEGNVSHSGGRPGLVTLRVQDQGALRERMPSYQRNDRAEREAYRITRNDGSVCVVYRSVLPVIVRDHDLMMWGLWNMGAGLQAIRQGMGFGDSEDEAYRADIVEQDDNQIFRGVRRAREGVQTMIRELDRRDRRQGR